MKVFAIVLAAAAMFYAGNRYAKASDQEKQQSVDSAKQYVSENASKAYNKAKQEAWNKACQECHDQGK